MNLKGSQKMIGEVYRAPRSWAERNYHNIINFHQVEKGGPFASWQQPELFAARSERRSDHCANTYPTIEPKETHR